MFRAHPRLKDKDVEAVYEQLLGFFKKLAGGADLEEPFSTITHKQQLIEVIIAALDAREEMGGDQHVLQNPEYRLGALNPPAQRQATRRQHR